MERFLKTQNHCSEPALADQDIFPAASPGRNFIGRSKKFPIKAIGSDKVAFNHFFRHRNADKRKPGKNAPLCACFSAHSRSPSVRSCRALFCLNALTFQAVSRPYCKKALRDSPLFSERNFFRFIFPRSFSSASSKSLSKGTQELFSKSLQSLFLRVPSRFPNRTDH